MVLQGIEGPAMSTGDNFVPRVLSYPSRPRVGEDPGNKVEQEKHFARYLRFINGSNVFGYHKF